MRNWIAGILFSAGIALIVFGISFSLQELEKERELQRQVIEIEAAIESLELLSDNYEKLLNEVDAIDRYTEQLRGVIESVRLSNATSANEELERLDGRIEYINRELERRISKLARATRLTFFSTNGEIGVSRFDDWMSR